MKTRAVENATTIEQEILASGQVRQDAYYGALAKVLGLPLVLDVDPASVVVTPLLDSQLSDPRMLRINRKDLPPQMLIVPVASRIGEQKRFLSPALFQSGQIAVTTPSTVRQAVWSAGAVPRVDAAAERLFDQSPDLSARSVLTGGQGFLAGLLVTSLTCSALLFPLATLQVVHAVLSLLFCILIVMRAVAIGWGRHRPAPQAALETLGPLPVYTVLVALYREKAVAAQLVQALRRLNWPVSRLDIKLICEQDDEETIAALRNLDLPPHFEIVEVPDQAPRTKPKALNYGLAGARGEFVVIYDAEDRPHRDQLLEAYQRFATAPSDLACLQAPLIIANARESWISALFALEYSGLFRRLLPFLAARQQPIPLGGTSNHFRTSILRAAGGWDPYNVTEDADLGMRLYRLGYRAGTLTHYTIEDAPTESSVWVGQRSRWFKGWMQTWLVLMRKPILLSRELGWSGTLMFHAVVTGMLVSALGHPLLLFFIGMCLWNLVFAPHSSHFELTLFAIDWFNILAAYTVFSRLGFTAMAPNERRRVGTSWRYVPVYWMMMSYAAWKAMIELRRNPHFWNKTPHKPSGSALYVPPEQGGKAR